jgi:hypothetical protein
VDPIELYPSLYQIKKTVAIPITVSRLPEGRFHVLIYINIQKFSENWGNPF